MKTYDAVRIAADSAGFSLAALSRELGHPNSYISGAIARGSAPSTTNAARMFEACGWKLAAIPKSDVPPSAIVIDPAEKAE